MTVKNIRKMSSNPQLLHFHTEAMQIAKLFPIIIIPCCSQFCKVCSEICGTELIFLYWKEFFYKFMSFCSVSQECFNIMTYIIGHILKIAFLYNTFQVHGQLCIVVFIVPFCRIPCFFNMLYMNIHCWINKNCSYGSQ